MEFKSCCPQTCQEAPKATCREIFRGALGKLYVYFLSYQFFLAINYFKNLCCSMAFPCIWEVFFSRTSSRLFGWDIHNHSCGFCLKKQNSKAPVMELNALNKEHFISGTWGVITTRVFLNFIILPQHIVYLIFLCLRYFFKIIGLFLRR